MTKTLNHYEFLGVLETASEGEIERAIIRFEDPAYALAYADPERNDGLYDLLIHMRADLLSGPVRRRAYERSLHPGTTLVIDGMDVAELSGEPWRVPPDDGDEEEQLVAPGRVRGLLAGVALALLLTVTIAAGVQRANPFSQASPPSVSLFMSGFPGTRQIVSDSVVRLSWTPVKGVLAYQVQVATVRRGFPPHVFRSLLTDRTSFDLRVTGQRTYTWRVRTGGSGEWASYTFWDTFSVPAPAIGVPARLQAIVRHSGSHQIARVCWSPVHAAHSYLLLVHAGHRSIIRGTCASMTVRPGSYAWTVAAQVVAARLYTGPRSGTNRFVVAQPTHRKSRTHRATSRVSAAPVPSSSQRASPQQIVVAVAPPPVAPATATGSSSKMSGSSRHTRTARHTRSFTRTTVKSAMRRIAARRRRSRSAARFIVHVIPTAVRLPVRHVVLPAGVSSHGSVTHSGSTYIPLPPPPPAIPVATHLSGTIPPPPPPPPIP